MRCHKCFVDELRHLSSTYLAHSHDEPAECFKDRARSRYSLLIATDHHGERTCSRPRSTATDGGIDQGNLTGSSLLRQRDDCVRMHGGMNRDAPTRPHGRNELFAHLPDACIVYDTDTNMSCASTQFGDAGNCFGCCIVEGREG